MSNPLDPIWDRYQTTRDALKVVRRCLPLPGVDRAKAFGNTRFYGLADQDCLHLVDRAESELNDATVLSLYATFETRLRDHVAGQSALLSNAVRPDPSFGTALSVSFKEYCEGHRMDELTKLFAGAVGQSLIAQVGTIRTYRHWIAHGRAWAAPPNMPPLFAYTTLTSFLQSAGLV